MTMSSKEFCRPFIEAGVIPNGVRRMIIDIEAGQAVKVYYDTFGQETLLQMITPQMLTDNQEIKHADGPEIVQGERTDANNQSGEESRSHGTTEDTQNEGMVRA